MNWTPMGSPPPLKPQGTVMAGSPLPFMGLVLREMKPEAGAPSPGGSAPFRSTSTAVYARSRYRCRGRYQEVHILQNPGVFLLDDALDLHGF